MSGPAYDGASASAAPVGPTRSSSDLPVSSGLPLPRATDALPSIPRAAPSATSPPQYAGSQSPDPALLVPRVSGPSIPSPAVVVVTDIPEPSPSAPPRPSSSTVSAPVASTAPAPSTSPPPVVESANPYAPPVVPPVSIQLPVEVVVAATGLPLAVNGRVDVSQPGGESVARRFSSYVPPSRPAADGSCAVPGYPYEGLAPSSSIPRRASSTVLLGDVDERYLPLDTDALSYPWEPFPRKGVTLAIVMEVADPRPDLRRFQLMAGHNPDLKMGVAWHSYVTQEPAFQVPAEIPCDRTFVFSVNDAKYIDHAARYVFGTTSPGDTPLPLHVVRELYVFPSSASWTSEFADDVKASSSLMRIDGRALGVVDWRTHRRSDQARTRVTKTSAWAIGLGPDDFASLSSYVTPSFPPEGVSIALPLALQYFGYAADDGRHPCIERLRHVVCVEWAGHLTSAYMLTVLRESRAHLVSTRALAFVRYYAHGVPDMMTHADDDGGRFRAWTFAEALDIIEGALKTDGSLWRSWVDYATRQSSNYVGYSNETGTFRRAPGSSGEPLTPRTRGQSGVKRGYAEVERRAAPDVEPVIRAVNRSVFGRRPDPYASDELPASTARSIVASEIPASELRTCVTSFSLLERAKRHEEKWYVGDLAETLSRWYVRRDAEGVRAEDALRDARAMTDMARARADEAAAANQELRMALVEVRNDRDRLRSQRDYWKAHVSSGPSRDVPHEPARDVRPVDPYAYLDESRSGDLPRNTSGRASRSTDPYAYPGSSQAHDDLPRNTSGGSSGWFAAPHPHPGGADGDLPSRDRR